jgi:hypothetical protein
MKHRDELLMLSAGSLALVAAACSVQKKNSTPADTDTAVTAAPAVVAPQASPSPQPSPVPTSPVAPSAAQSAKDSVKPLPKPPTKIKREPPVEGGLRDSAVQPVMGIGPDGKLHPIKK